jgi:hypothetical protein
MLPIPRRNKLTNLLTYFKSFRQICPTFLICLVLKKMESHLVLEKLFRYDFDSTLSRNTCLQAIRMAGRILNEKQF